MSSDFDFLDEFSAEETGTGYQPNREELLQMAVNSAKGGNTEGARVMLRQVLSGDTKNVKAMLWMAKIAPTRTDRIQWLNKVLEVDPGNETATAAMKKMHHTRSRQDNRVLFIFGVIVVILLVLGVGIVAVVLSTAG